MVAASTIYIFLGVIANIVGLTLYWIINQEMRYAKVRKLAEQMGESDSELVLEMIKKCQDINKFWDIFFGRTKKARWISKNGSRVSKKDKELMADVFAGLSILDHIHLDRLQRYLKKKEKLIA